MNLPLCNVVTKVRTEPVDKNAEINQGVNQAASQHSNQTAGVIDGLREAESVVQYSASKLSQDGEDDRAQKSRPKLPKPETKPEEAISHYLAPLAPR
jgi:hypothetical protein